MRTVKYCTCVHLMCTRYPSCISSYWHIFTFRVRKNFLALESGDIFQIIFCLSLASSSVPFIGPRRFTRKKCIISALHTFDKESDQEKKRENRKHALDQECDQEKTITVKKKRKKERSRPRKRHNFLVFFYKFSPLVLGLLNLFACSWFGWAWTTREPSHAACPTPRARPPSAPPSSSTVSTMRQHPGQNVFLSFMFYLWLCAMVM